MNIIQINHNFEFKFQQLIYITKNAGIRLGMCKHTPNSTIELHNPSPNRNNNKKRKSDGPVLEIEPKSKICKNYDQKLQFDYFSNCAGQDSLAVSTRIIQDRIDEIEKEKKLNDLIDKFVNLTIQE
jgi:hypothetical protein